MNLGSFINVLLRIIRALRAVVDVVRFYGFAH
jgi:hypothetical protein